ncbi:MAG: Sua5 family C-terminal domain-containing protein [Actinomycetota bacterium]
MLDCSQDLALVARTLYASLRDLDRRGVHDVNVLLPPPRGLGHAIRDRLHKAASPR